MARATRKAAARAPRTARDLLIVQRPAPAMDAPVSRVGGHPLAPRGVPWPGCATCGDPMQFVLQVRLRDLGGVLGATDGLLLVWRCATQAAGCEPWEPDGRASFATFTLLRDLAVLQPPEGWRRLEPPYALFGCHELMLAPCDRPLREDFDDEDAWRDADPYQRLVHEDPDVVGLVTPRLDWLRGDPGLRCGDCDRPLIPLLQLESKAGGGIGFGALGAGYALHCDGCCAATWIEQDTPGFTLDEAAPLEDALDEAGN